MTLRIITLTLLVFSLLNPSSCWAATPASRSPEYTAVQQRLAKGWNTWDTHSVLSHVLLPQGLSISVGVLNDSSIWQDQTYLDRALIGRQGSNVEQVLAGPHAYDGSYSDLTLVFAGNSLRVQSATEGDDLVMMVTPLHTANIPPAAVFRVGMLWNRPGKVFLQGNSITAELASANVQIYPAGETEQITNIWTDTPYFAERLDAVAGVSTGHRRTIKQIENLIDANRAKYERGLKSYAGNAEIVDAMQSVLAWDTIYEPTHDRVITPVSRVWNERWGGYVLFDWDTFFAAEMAGLNNRDLAYANAIEMLRETTHVGFVPNSARAKDWRSEDRSEPPVGSLVVLDLYRHYHDRWFLEEAFPALLTWNRWWAEHRDRNGYLVWGSDPYLAPWVASDSSIHTLQGAKFESGLDNSPMYDDAGFDPERSQMELADVGLISMYISDCGALATIASDIGRDKESAELKQRADKYQKQLQTLWSEKDGIFLNKDLRTGAFSHRLSPTNFYPMLAKAATEQQTGRMVREHLQNPDEFWGKWTIPSIARNDPAFKEQDYWRGRIWGPMNFLVYRGLCNYNLPDAREALVTKSSELFLKEWRDQRHVHENYNAITGGGDDVLNSDRFYHWGALLGFIQILDQQKPD